MKRYRLDELLEIPDNWPISPRFHIDDSIEELAEFPRNTLFYEVDKNDTCTLFSIDKADVKRKFDDNFFYVAIWNRYLKDALDNNLVKNFVCENENIIFPLGYFTLSDNGYRSALYSKLISDNYHSYHVESIKSHIVYGNYDAAIREIAVKLEDKIRKVCGATSRYYGMKLIDNLIENAPQKDKILPHHLQHYRIRFKRFFAFVRNEFAHKIQNPDLAQTIVTISRCSELFVILDEELGYSGESGVSVL